MADPTTIVTGHLNRDVDKDAVILVVKNAEPLVIGGLAALDEATGNVEFADDTAGLLPVGVVAEGKYGNNDTLTGNVGGTVSIKSRGGAIIKNVTVTGVTGIADISKYVYATDGQTMSLTPTAEELPIGVVTGWVERSTCDVYLFNMIESRTNVGVMGVVNAIDKTTGVADAGKIIKTRSDGLLDDSFLVPEVVLESELIDATTGVADAGKPIKTRSDGLLDDSFLVPEVVLESELIDATTGVADAGKPIKTDATGKIDKSFLPADSNVAYMSLGTFPARSLQQDQVISTHVALRGMVITAVQAQIRGSDTNVVSGSAEITLKIGGTPITGGLVALTFENFNGLADVGSIVAGTAITAGNTVTAGQTITAVNNSIDTWSDFPGATFELIVTVTYT